MSKKKNGPCREVRTRTGSMDGILCFYPHLGSAISIVLGMMRANIWIVILAMTIGKVLRYALLVWGVLEASALMK